MRHIQTKITLTYIVFAFLVIVAVGLLSSIGVESYFTRHLVRELGSHADAIVLLVTRDASLPGDTLDLRLKELGRAANIRITLIDATGTVLTDSDVPFSQLPRIENHLQRPEIQEALHKKIGWNTRHSTTVGREMLYMAKAVEIPPIPGVLQNLKFIRVSVPLENVQRSLAEIRFNIFLAGLGVLLLVFVVSTFISRRISRPMAAIAEGVQRIRSGDLEARIEVNSEDEIGQVANAVNDMVGKLKEDIVHLKKLERVRSEFLGNVSHELRTPLFSLQGFLETLMEGAVDDPKVNREFLQKAYSHASRLNVLLGDLITISHIESGEMKMSFRYFQIKEFLSHVAKDFQSVAEQNHVKIRFDDRIPGDPEVMGDKERLRVVMDNLIQNAIKYNKHDGTVVIACQSENGTVRVSVTDTGVGIEPDHQPRVFERFYRVDKNRSREVGGTGLGLAIVKHIIEAHGSTVRLTSAVGKGSTFSFTLKT
jgi:two-component system, OmpR family, phosphate regulon sensor histidine kinase PhoR